MTQTWLESAQRATTERHAARAIDEREAFALLTRRELATAVYEPANASHHYAGLAAYAAWLADLYGWNES
jgi:hypothetical protein